MADSLLGQWLPETTQYFDELSKLEKTGLKMLDEKKWDELRELPYEGIETAVKRFLQEINQISMVTGRSTTEAFWDFIEWTFWINMAETANLAAQIEKLGLKGLGEFLPYTTEHCLEECFKTRNYMVPYWEAETLSTDCFRNMQHAWISSSENGEDFPLQLVQLKSKEMTGTLSKALGQFFTPPSLGKLMAKMVGTAKTRAPDDEWPHSEVVSDPCAGFGGLLVQHWLENQEPDQPIGSIYYAGELNRRTAMACWLNLQSHGIPAIIDNIDSLSGERISPRWYTAYWIAGLTLADAETTHRMMTMMVATDHVYDTRRYGQTEGGPPQWGLGRTVANTVRSHRQMQMGSRSPLK